MTRKTEAQMLREYLQIKAEQQKQSIAALRKFLGSHDIGQENHKTLQEIYFQMKKEAINVE